MNDYFSQKIGVYIAKELAEEFQEIAGEIDSQAKLSVLWTRESLDAAETASMPLSYKSTVSSVLTTPTVGARAFET